MIVENLVKERVHHYYWDLDINCATTTLKILSELHSIVLTQQTLNSAIGMHGAGLYRAQCGLVEGGLMFIGIYGKENNLTNEQIEKLCFNFAADFEQQFGSLLCKELRPEGFNPTNPPHICESLSVSTILYTHQFIMENIKTSLDKGKQK